MPAPSDHPLSARIVTGSASAALVLAARLQSHGIQAFVASESTSLNVAESCVRAAEVWLPSAAFDAALEVLAEPRIDDGELDAAAMAEPCVDDACRPLRLARRQLLVLLAVAVILFGVWLARR